MLGAVRSARRLSAWRALSSSASPSKELPPNVRDMRHGAMLRHRTAVTNRLWERRGLEVAVPLTSSSDLQPAASRPHQLRTKHMLDSYIMERLPFRTDLQLRDDYLNQYGNLRVGKVLEDLDAFAGSIAYAHCDDGDPSTQPLTIVTASVDHIILLSRLRAESDMRMRGHVTWVGRSSMEVTIVVESEKENANDEWDKLVFASFVMVARDPATNKAHQVNPLKLTDDALERTIFEASDRRMQHKKEEQQRSLLSKPPTAEESQLMHQLYLDTMRGQCEAVPMSATHMSSARICFPQERNIHGKLFGGYLMREAYELAYANAMMFCRGRPSFVAQDDITFRKPVEIGSILNFSSRVVLCQGAPHRTFQVQVTAEVIDPVSGARDTTNVFHYTFLSDTPLKPIRPHTYEEWIAYVAGLRRRNTSRSLAIMKDCDKWVLPPPADMVWLQ